MSTTGARVLANLAIFDQGAPLRSAAPGTARGGLWPWEARPPQRPGQARRRYTDQTTQSAAPKLTPEAVQWVIGKKPKIYTDDFDVVPVPPSKRVFLEAGICHVMNITNVDQIRKNVVTLIALPLKLRRTNAGEGVEASPTRAVAIEED